MSTYTQIMYQIIFSTYYREKTLIKSGREELFKYISGVLKNKSCKLYQINGVEDHIHILTHLHPSVALANLVKDIKISTSKVIKESKIFPAFNGWQAGYGTFTYSIDRKNTLIKYIQNQEARHAKVDFIDEFKELLKEHGIDFDEKYLL